MAEQQFGANAGRYSSFGASSNSDFQLRVSRSPSAKCAYSGVVYTRLGYTQLLPSGDSLGGLSRYLLLIHGVNGCELIGGFIFRKCTNSGVDVSRLGHTQQLLVAIHLVR